MRYAFTQRTEMVNRYIYGEKRGKQERNMKKRPMRTAKVTSKKAKNKLGNGRSVLGPDFTAGSRMASFESRIKRLVEKEC
jgi:hypothetical protein